MAASEQDIEKGHTALRNYVFTIDGWEASFVPSTAYDSGVKVVLDTWDESKNVAACGQVLYQDISDAGYGSRVTPDQCHAAAVAVLAATGRIKT